MTNDEMLDYYANLLIVQYATKRKAIATIKAFVTQMIANQVVVQVRDGFDLETAVGTQLDTLGGYRGANRLQFGLTPGRTYFSMPAYADGDIGTVPGFSLYSQGATGNGAYWTQYADVNQPTYRLTDDELQRLIKFKALVHQSKYGLGQLDTILFEFFGTKVNLVDNKDMTITYHHTVPDTDTLFSIVNQTGSLPKPAGVAVTVLEP